MLCHSNFLHMDQPPQTILNWSEKESGRGGGGGGLNNNNSNLLLINSWFNQSMSNQYSIIIDFYMGNQCKS